MEFTAKKSLLLPALNRLCSIARSENKNFQQLGHLSIKVADGKVLLASSNGYIKAVQELKDEDLKIIKEGSAVVNVSSLRDIVKAAPEGERINLSINGENLFREIVGQKRKVRIPTIKATADVEVKEVNSKNKFVIEADVFMSSLAEVCPYAGKEVYREKYQQVYLDFRKDETRFVCGDGGFFVILINKSELNADKAKADDKGYVIPSSQASILMELFDETKMINITFAPTSYSFATDSGLSVVLDGIPMDVGYVPYEIQWERFKERNIMFRLTDVDLSSLVDDLQAIRDTDYEKKNNCIPITLSAEKEGISFTSEFTNGLDYTVEPAHFECFGEEKSISLDFSLDTFVDTYKLGKMTTYEFSMLPDIGFCRFLSDDDNRQRVLFFSKIIETDL